MKQLLFISLFLLCISSFGAVKSIKVLTDNTPDWNDIPSAWRSMTNSLANDEQKAIALWKWIGPIRHQVSPMKDDSSASQGQPGAAYGVIYNPLKVANNYGNAFCVNTNSFPAFFWKKMGKAAQEYDINGHTVCDLQWNSAWHNFDPAFGFYYKDTQTGQILDCQTIVSRRMTMSNMCSDVTYYNIFDPANQTNASIYQKKTVWNILQGTSEYSGISATRTTLFSETYCDGYTYKLNMKPYESFTRRWTQIDPANSQYFISANGGTSPNPNIDNAASTGTLNIQTNGIWVFKPDLTVAKALEAFSVKTNLEQGGGTALHPAATGSMAVAVYRVDGANIMCHAVVSGSYKRTASADVFQIQFSTDSSSWTTIYTGAGTGTQAFSQEFGTRVRQRDFYYLKFNMSASAVKTDCGLAALTVTTYTVCNPRGIPKLTLGSNRIKFAMGAGAMEPLEIIYFFTEYDRSGTTKVARPRVHKKTVSAATVEYLINTGGFRNPQMDSVRLCWPNTVPAIAEGYSDGIDVGAANEAPRYYYTFGRNIGLGKTCTSTPTITNPQALTDNAPGAAGWGQNINPEIIVDLGSAQSVGGIRMATIISSGNGEYLDSGIVSSSSDNVTFAEQGRFYYRQVWEPITNYNHVNIWDYSPAMVAQKHCNITFFKFSCAFAATPTTARYVKVKVFNALASLAVSELEVYNTMTRTLVNNELDHGWTLPDPGITAPERGLTVVEKATGKTGRDLAGIEASPNPFSPATNLTIYTGKAGIRENLKVTVYSLDGKRVATILSSPFRMSNAVTARWDASAFPPGVYVVRAKAGNTILEKRITLIK